MDIYTISVDQFIMCDNRDSIMNFYEAIFFIYI